MGPASSTTEVIGERRSSVPFDLRRPILSPVLTAAVRAGDGADPKLCSTTSSSRRSAREESTRAAILAYVAEHPGCTTNQITAVIAGRREDVLAARDALIEEIALLTVKGANRALLHYTNSSGSQHTGTTGNHRPVDAPSSSSHSHRPRWEPPTRFVDDIDAELDAEYDRLLGGGLS